MDKKEHLYNFDDIRPLNDNEVEQAIETLVSSEGLQRALRFIKPELDWETFVATMRSCKTKAQFKSTIGYNAVMDVARFSTFSLTISGRSRLTQKTPCTFISIMRHFTVELEKVES